MVVDGVGVGRPVGVVGGVARHRDRASRPAHPRAAGGGRVPALECVAGFIRIRSIGYCAVLDFLRLILARISGNPSQRVYSEFELSVCAYPVVSIAPFIRIEVGEVCRALAFVPFSETVRVYVDDTAAFVAHVHKE